MSEVKVQYAHFRDPDFPEGDPPSTPTSRIEVLHDTCWSGSLEISKPTIDKRIKSGAVVERYLSESGAMYPMLGPNGVPLSEMLSQVEAFCAPIDGNEQAFDPKEWTSEELLMQVYEKVQEYHATFR